MENLICPIGIVLNGYYEYYIIVSEYYKSQRTSNLYEANSTEQYRLSRNKIELYLDCERCFYFDRKLGKGRPPGYPFSLNSAVDTLLKREFDQHRENGTVHPLVKSNGLNLVPLNDDRIEEWRDALRRGITHHMPGTNIRVTGAVDDVWVDPSSNQLSIVDYKATSKLGVVSIDSGWQAGYKRQMEMYQWLFRQNGFDVSDTGYFVYCNGRQDAPAFDSRLEFEVSLIPYTGNDSWVGNTVSNAYNCLQSDEIPNRSTDCDYCEFIDQRVT